MGTRRFLNKSTTEQGPNPVGSAEKWNPFEICIFLACIFSFTMYLFNSYAIHRFITELQLLYWKLL
jgi:hypothetical protein